MSLSTLEVFSTLGDVMSTGGYHEYSGGYHEYTGGYHDECRGIIINRPEYTAVSIEIQLFSQ